MRILIACEFSGRVRDEFAKLVPTHKKSDYEKITAACHAEAPGPESEKNRSRTYPSIAKAMTSQWGNL